MPIIQDKDAETLKDVFKNLERDVTIVLFNAEGNEAGEVTTELLRELTALSDKLHLEEHDFASEQALAKEYNVQLKPAFVLLDSEGKFTRIRFNGVPMGHEINSLLSSIVEVGADTPPMPEEMLERAQAIEGPVDIKVFVTLSCPHCPGAVQKAHALARVNPNIQAEMIDAETFSEMSDDYGVGSVPHIVFNDGQAFVGNQPFEDFLAYAEEAGQIL